MLQGHNISIYDIADDFGIERRGQYEEDLVPLILQKIGRWWKELSAIKYPFLCRDCNYEFRENDLSRCPFCGRVVCESCQKKHTCKCGMEKDIGLTDHLPPLPWKFAPAELPPKSPQTLSKPSFPFVYTEDGYDFDLAIWDGSQFVQDVPLGENTPTHYAWFLLTPPLTKGGIPCP